MAKTRISALAAITALALSATDVMPITDTSVPKTNKVTMAQLRTALFAGGTGYAADPLVADSLTLTNAATVGGLIGANAGLQVGGAAPLGATATALLSFEAPVLRIYTGDGTGYSTRFSRRVGGVTTDLVTITDTGAITGTSSLTLGGTIAGQLVVKNDNNTQSYILGSTGVVHGTDFLIYDNTVGATRLTIAASGALNHLGDFSVNTNKFTVAAASGNTVAAGTVTAAGVILSGGSFSAGSITKNPTSGLLVCGVAGSTYDINITSPAGVNIISVPTGTINTQFAGSLLVSGVGVVATVDKTSGASLLGMFNVKRAGTSLYYFGSDASDRGVILNAAATVANLTWTDTGDFTMRGGVTMQALTATTGAFASSGNAIVTNLSTFNGTTGTAAVNRNAFGNSSATDTFVIDVYGGGHATRSSQVWLNTRSAIATLVLATNDTAAITISAATQGVTLAGALSTGSTITGGASIVAGAASAFVWSGRSQMTSGADGFITMMNNAGTSLTMLALGAVSTDPALKNFGSFLGVRQANDTAYLPLRASSLLADSFNASFFTGTAKFIGGTTGTTIRNNADSADNLLITDAGAVTIRAGLTVTAGATTLGGGVTISTGGLAVTGASAITGTLSVSSAITATGGVTGALTGNASTATALQNARTIGGTSFDGTANITVASATGGFTVSGGTLTAAAATFSGLITASAGITVTGTLTMATAVSKLVPGATSFSHRNNADSADNLLITDAGAVTIRSTLGVTSDLAVNTNKFTVAAASGNAVIAGTLTVASTVNVTLGALTVSTGAITATANSINAGSFVSAIGGKVQLTGNAFTVSVSTSATNCTVGTNTAGALALVNGSDGTNRFADLVFYSQSTVTVLASQTLAAAPAARTYTCVSGGLKLAMGSGTYNVYAQELQNTTNA